MQERKQVLRPPTVACTPSHRWGNGGKKPNSFPDQKGFICEEQQTGQGSGCSDTQIFHSSKAIPFPRNTVLLSFAACFFPPMFEQGFASDHAKVLCKLARECLHGHGTCSTARERLGAGRGALLPSAAGTDPSVTAGALGAAAPK